MVTFLENPIYFSCDCSHSLLDSWHFLIKVSIKVHIKMLCREHRGGEDMWLLHISLLSLSEASGAIFVKAELARHIRASLSQLQFLILNSRTTGQKRHVRVNPRASV